MQPRLACTYQRPQRFPECRFSGRYESPQRSGRGVSGILEPVKSRFITCVELLPDARTTGAHGPSVPALNNMLNEVPQPPKRPAKSRWANELSYR